MASPQYAGQPFQKWQLGIESTFGTAVAATYNPLVAGDPTMESPWEDIPYDPGQFESPVLPVRTKGYNTDIPWTGGAFFQTLPFWFKGIIIGGQAPSAYNTNARFWRFTSGQSNNALDSYTAEHVGALNTWRQKAVYLSDASLDFDESGGMWTFSANGHGQSFGSNTQTAGITPDAQPSPLLGAFTRVFVDNTPGAMGTTLMAGNLRKGSIQFGFEAVEEKLTSGTGFDYTALGYGRRMTTYSFTFEQNAQSMTEVQAALVQATVPAFKYVKLVVTGNVISGSSPGTQEELRVELPGSYRSFGFERIGQNVVWTIGGQVVYDQTLARGLRAEVVNNKSSY